MRSVRYQIVGITPYSQSKKILAEKEPEENYDHFEERVWKLKATVNPQGIVCAPGISFKNALDIAAKRASDQVPGKGKATWTARFRGGTSPLTDMFPLYTMANGRSYPRKGSDPIATSELAPIKIDEAAFISLWCDSTGKRGGGSRVLRYFPYYPQWLCEPEFMVLDDTIPTDVCDKYFESAGLIVGIGRYRPENNGTNGRWAVLNSVWTKLD
jgi:hypothetical protein